MQVTVTNENILQGSFKGLLHIFYRTMILRKGQNVVIDLDSKHFEPSLAGF